MEESSITDESSAREDPSLLLNEIDLNPKYWDRQLQAWHDFVGTSNIKINIVCEPQEPMLCRSTRSIRNTKLNHLAKPGSCSGTSSGTTTPTTPPVKTLDGIDITPIWEKPIMLNNTGKERDFAVVPGSTGWRVRKCAAGVFRFVISRIRDRASTRSDSIMIFDEYGTVKAQNITPGPLTKGVCPVDARFTAVAEAEEIAGTVCNLVNRWPVTTAQLYKQWDSMIKKLIVKIALLLTRPQIFSVLDENLTYEKGPFGLPGMRPLVLNSATKSAGRVSRLWLPVDGNGTLLSEEKGGSINCILTHRFVNVEAVEARINETIPALRPMLNQQQELDQDLRTTADALGWIFTQFVGLVATTADLEKLKKLFLQQVYKEDSGTVPPTLGPTGYLRRPMKLRTGIYNGHCMTQIAQTHRSYPAGLLLPSDDVVSSLSFHGTFPELLVYGADAGSMDIVTACIVSYFQRRFAEGINILNAWQSTVELACRFNQGLMSLEDAIEEYCHCYENPHDGSRNDYHSCMKCFSELPCDELIVVLPESGNTQARTRRFCVRCKDLVTGKAEHRTADFFLTAIYRSTFSQVQACHQREGPNASYDKAGIFKAVSKDIVINRNTETWQPFHDKPDNPRPMLLSYPERFPTGYRRNARRHPFQPSIDAIYPIWIDQKGKSWIHHPDSCQLSTLCLNLMRRNFAISIYPAIQKMAELALDYEQTKDASNRQTEWDTVQTALDHQYLMRRTYPFTRKARLAMGISRRDWEEERWPIQFRGIYDPKVVPLQTISMTYSMASCEDEDLECEEQYQPGTDIEVEAELGEISGISYQELTFDEKRKNFIQLYDELKTQYRKSVKPPKECADGTPWLFLNEHFIQDFRFLDLLRMGSARLLRMKNMCNKRHTTDESPSTLIAELLIQWFQTNGRTDTFFHSGVTFLSCHPRSLSIGRNRHVEPGSVMRSGFQNKNPHTIREYDPKRVTIVMETFMANSVKADFLQRDVDQILPDFAQRLASSSQFYSNPLEDEGLLAVRFPSTLSDLKRVRLDSGILHTTSRSLVSKKRRLSDPSES